MRIIIPIFSENCVNLYYTYTYNYILYMLEAMGGLMSSVRNFLKRILPYVSVGLLSFFCTFNALANPVLDNIAHGNVTVQQTPTSTTVNQSSQTAVINWQSFNIGKGESTHFNQPTGGVALNRINPNQGASQIWGNLSATGRIILINSAGIFFGPGAFVNVGGLIATTAGMSDENFLKGIYKFDQPSMFNGAVVNKGTIIAVQNGLVALAGGAVSNEGYIQADLGKVVLASGSTFTMSFSGDNLISFAVDQKTLARAIDANGNLLPDGVSNTGHILANGGQVLIHAKAASGLLDHVINMGGVVEARAVYQDTGSVVLSADPNEKGTIRVSGTIDASGKGVGEHGGDITITGENIVIDGTSLLDVRGNVSSGKINIGGPLAGGILPTANSLYIKSGAKLFADGGFVETSAKQVLSVESAEVHAGNWLLDPYDLIIGSGIDNALSGSSPYSPTDVASFLSTNTLIAALASGNVVVQTTSSGEAGNGDIIITSLLSYSSNYSLMLSAYRHIVSTLSGDVIKNTGSGEVVLRADNSGTGVGTIQFTGTTPTVTASGGVRVYYNPTTFGTQDALFTSGGGTTTTQYMLIQSLGFANDETTTPTLGALSNGINAALWLPGKNYALAKDINATATLAWNSGSGFRPIGNYNFTLGGIVVAHGVPFSGKFDGQGYTISNLYINQPDLQTLGMFGRLASTASVTNLGLPNITINYNSSNANNLSILTATRYIGAFAAYVDSGATLSNVYADGFITHSGEGASGIIGGLVGQSAGSLSFAESNIAITASNTVSSNSFIIGGAIGKTTGGSITNVSSLNNIATSGSINSQILGGLVGENAATITKSFSIGTIVATGGTKGGLVGANTGSISNSYWNTTTSGLGSSAGGSPLTTSQMQNSSNFTGLDFINDWNIIAGTSFPYHRFIYSSTPRVISGSVPSITNTNSELNLYASGAYKRTSYSFADDSFYLLFKNGAIADSSKLLLYLNNANLSADYIAAAPSANGSLTSLALVENTLTLGGTGNLSHADIVLAKGSINDADVFFSVLEGNLSLASAKNFATLASMVYQPEGNLSTSGGGTISIASAMNFANDFVVTASGNSTISGVISNTANKSFTKSGSGTLTLSNIANDFTGNIIVNAGTLAVTSNGVLGNVNNDIFLNDATLSSAGNNTLGTGRSITLNTGNNTISSSSGTLTIAGSINGASAFTLSGAGNISLNGVVGVASLISSVTGLTLGANVTTSGAQTYTTAITLGANALLTATVVTIGDVNGAGFNLAINNTFASTIAGAIAGTGTSLTKSGSGSLTLLGSSNYSGGTIVNGGSLIISSDANLGSVGGSVTLNGATLYTDSNLSLDNSRNLILGASGGLFNTNSGSLTIGGVISNSGSLTKLGNGSLILNNSNSYSGGTLLSAGNLYVANDNALGTGALTFPAGSSGTLVFTNNRVINNNIAFTGSGIIDQNNTASRLNGFLSGNGGITFNNTGGSNTTATYIQIDQNNSSLGGIVTLNAGTLAIGNDFAFGNATLNIYDGNIRASGAPRTISNNINAYGDFILGRLTTLNGNLTLYNNITISAHNYDNPADADSTFNGVIGESGGARALTIGSVGNGFGSGAFVFNGTNTYSGGTVISAGTVKINNANALGTGLVTVNTSLQVLSNINLTNPLKISGVVTSVGNNTLSGPITLVGSASISNNSGTLDITNTIDGISSGLGGLALGGSTIRLYNNIGATNPIFSLFSSAPILLAGDVVINSASNVIFFNTINSVNSNHSLTINSNVTTTLSSNIGAVMPLSSIVTDAGGVTSFGPSVTTVTTSGAQTYGDGLNISSNIAFTGGDITVNGAMSSGFSNTITFNGSGTLALNGLALIGNLISNKTSTVLGNNITTIGTQSYANTVSLGTVNDVILAGTTITFNTLLNWLSTKGLTVQPSTSVTFNNAITAPNGSLTINAPNTVGGIVLTSNTTVDVNNFILTQGQWSQNNVSLPSFNVRNNFQLGNGNTLPNNSLLFLRVAGGTGDDALNSYLIKDVYGLQGIGSHSTTISKFYKLANDIDASLTRNWNNGAGFIPIGSYSGSDADHSGRFTGTIDGLVNATGNITSIIKNIYINRPGTNYVGLIGYADGGATIKNTGLVNADITGYDSVGIVVGRVLSNSNIPGLSIQNVYTTGNVTGTTAVGGLVGRFESGTIQTSYNDANVYGYDSVGGIVGKMEIGAPNTFSYINNVYNIGTVTGTQNVGGLVGWGQRNNNSGVSEINNSYSAGLVIGATNVGGLLGGGNSSYPMTFSNVYWNTESSGQANATGGISINASNVIGFTFDQMLQSWNYAGFSIGTGPATSTASTWFMIDGYTQPMLMMEHSTNVRNAHQLQLMNANTTANYTLIDNIDLSATNTTKDVWRASSDWEPDPVGFLFVGSVGGFYPIGNRGVNFTGSFNGNYYSINNLNSLSNDSNTDMGLFGVTNGATIQKLFINDSVQYHLSTNSTSDGVLVGNAINSTIHDIFINNASFIYSLLDGDANYEQKNSYYGGAVGQLSGGSLTNTYTNVFLSTIDPMQDYRRLDPGPTWANHDINLHAGGLVGFNNAGTISSSSADGTIYIVSGTNDRIGGFVGKNVGTITDSYSSTGITMSAFVNLNSASIAGFVAENTGTIARTYATGLILKTNVTSYGGFAAINTGSITNSFWDTNTTGIATSVAGTAKTTEQLLDASTYSSWSSSITSTASTSATKPNTTWFIFDKNTRPMLLSAWSTDIRTPYQLQLAGTTLGANYTLKNDIDFFHSMRNSGDVWATNLIAGKGRGFVPIGYSIITNPDNITNIAGSNDFTGIFNGQGYTIENFYINRPVNINTVGLFGQVSGNANISNVNISDASVFGTSVTGILIGNMIGSGIKAISNVYVSGDVSSNLSSGNYLGLGGLIGRISVTGGSINVGQVYSTAYVYNNGRLTAGGLIGQMEATNATAALTNAYSSGRVTGSVGFGINAGLIGVIGDNASITNSLWDTVTSNQAYAYTAMGNNSSKSNLFGGCFGGTANCNIQPINANNVTAVDLSLLSTYVNAGWSTFASVAGSITSTPVASSILPNYTWYMVDGYTRPMLLAEWRTTINTPHQLQLMGAVLDANYTLGKNINITTTLNNPGEIWSTNQTSGINAGFAPIGTNTFSNVVQGTEFTGTFDGQGNSIQNLYINRPNTTTSVGLFGATANSVRINTLSLTDVSITGGSVVGGLIGNMISNANYAPILIDNIYVSGTVSGYSPTSYSGLGGLIGRFDVTATNTLGDKTIQNTYSTATVASSGGHNAGGFIGYLSSPNSYVQYSYSTGLVSASGLNVGGFVGVLNQGIVRRSLWDTVTSNQANGYGTIGSGSISNFIGGCFGGAASCAIQPLHASNVTAADLSLLATYNTNAGWSNQLRAITVNPSISHLKPNYSWFMANGSLRPMLLSEWSSNVSTAHQVQLMGAAQKGIYKVDNYIDFTNSMSNAAEVWATDKNANIGSGFYPIAHPPSWCYGCGYAGYMDGQNFTIDNLYMRIVQNFNITGIEPLNDSVAFIAAVFHDPLIQNITLANVDFSYDHISSGVDETYYQFGVLIGDINSRGAVIRNAFTSGRITTYSNATFTYIGGLAAKNYGGTIYTSGSSVDVVLNSTLLSNSRAGGLIGDMQNLSVIYNSYATGDVTVMGGASFGGVAGGFVGAGESNYIFNSYSTGKVSSVGFKGGFIGNCGGQCLNNNNFWDIDSSGVSSSAGATGKTTQEMKQLSTFTNWDITASPSITANTPNNTWFIFDGSTRPMLMSEWSASIANPHHLQMMGVALDANYTMANDIDLKSAMRNPSDVWGTDQIISSGKGFVPIGSVTAPFTGSLNGQGYTIDNLYINRSNSASDAPSPTTISIGLFSQTAEPAIIQNLGMTNVDINYITTTSNVSVNAGAFAGMVGSESIFRNIYAMGRVSVLGNFTNSSVGGITGGNVGVIQSAYSGIDVAVTGSPSANKMVTGGLVGTNYSSTGSITNAYSTGTVMANGAANTVYTGGFVGENQSNISLSYSSGKVLSISGDVGGFLGHATSGSIISSLWDMDSSGLDTSAGGVGKTTAELMQKSTFTNAGWVSITNTPAISPTKPATDWFIFEGGTRPILLSEWSRSISTPHQLQLVATTLAANYTLNKAIDLKTSMSNPADVWGTNSNNNVGAGFVSIGTSNLPFTGILNGEGYSINHLYMLQSANPIGLFGYIATGSTIKDVGLVNADLTYSNSNSTADVYAGLLVASAAAGSVIQNVYTMGDITVSGNFATGYIGGVVGSSSGTILNNYSNANVSATGVNTTTIYAGGLIGRFLSPGSLTNSYSMGAVNVGGNAINKYAGGLVGQNEGIISRTYSTGAVATSGTVTNSYVGGLAGASTTNITSSYWDINTSLKLTSAGGVGVVGKTTSEFLDLNTFTGWDITSSASSNSATPNNTWFIFDGNTRPILLSEWSRTISTPHQLQLMGAALGSNYELANDIDLTSAMNNTSEIWATNQQLNTGKGFYQVGAQETGNSFTGSFEGNNYIINNLYINRSNENVIGLFGQAFPNSIRKIQNLGFTNIDITGKNWTGGLIGYAENYRFKNIFVTGSVNSTGYNVGGIAGEIYSTIIDSAYNGANVTGIYDVGGVTGIAGVSIISNSYSTGNVSAIAEVGGLVGYNWLSLIRYSYASGKITGTDSGALVGYDYYSDYLANFFDTTASGLSNGIGNTFSSEIRGGCINGVSCLGGATLNLSDMATYTNYGWDINSTPSNTASKPTGTWFLFANSTRPMLSIEWNSNISTPHQLQLMGSTLGATYTLTKSFDLASYLNSTNSQSEVWGTNQNSSIGSGFVPIGSLSQPFTGIFEGNNYTISNLYIDRSNETIISEIGLFGAITMPAVINDLTLANVDINYNANGIGTAHIGTLVGYAGPSTTLDNILISGSLFASNNMASTTFNVGGIAGSFGGRMTAFYTDMPIAITASNSLTLIAGGLAGTILSSGLISQSYSIGQLSVSGSTSNNTSLGGIAGVNDGSLSKVYSLRTVLLSGSGVVGGLTGSGSGSATSSYWDKETTGIVSSAQGIGNTTQAMFDRSTYSTWDFVNTWNNVNNESYPFLRKLYPDTPRFVSGLTDAGNNAKISLLANGILVGTVYTGVSGFYYFILSNGIVVDGAKLLAYVDDNSIKANAIGVAPTNGGSLSGTVSGISIGLDMSSNTVTVGGEGTVDNSILGTAKGNSNDPDILYSYNSGNLAIGGAGVAVSNVNFSTSESITYNINGDIALLGDGVTATFNSVINLTGNRIISGVGATQVIFNTPVNLSTPLTLTANDTIFNGALSVNNTTLQINGDATIVGLTTLSNNALMNVTGVGDFVDVSLSSGSSLSIDGSGDFSGLTLLSGSGVSLSLGNNSTFYDLSINSGALLNLLNSSSLTVNGSTSIDNASLTIPDAATFTALTLQNGAALVANGDIVFNGAAIINGSTLTINNTRIFNDALTLHSGGVLDLNGAYASIFNGGVTLDGSGTEFTAANDVTFNDTLDITADASMYIDGNAEFNGAATFDLSAVTINNNAIFSNGILLNMYGSVLSIYGDAVFDSISADNSLITLFSNTTHTFNGNIFLASETLLTSFGTRNFNGDVTLEGTSEMDLYGVSDNTIVGQTNLSDSALYMESSGIFQQGVLLSGSLLVIDGSGTFNNLLSLTSGSHIAITGTTAVNHSLVFNNSTADLSGDVSFAIPINVADAIFTIAGNGTFGNTVALTNSEVSFGGSGLFGDTLSLTDSSLLFGNGATFNGNVNIAGTTVTLSSENSDTNSIIFNAPVNITAGSLVLNTDGSTSNDITFNDVVSNAANISLTGQGSGSKTYTFNQLLSLTNDMVVTISTAGEKIFNFNQGINGNKNLSFTGAAAGNYKFYFIDPLSISGLHITLPVTTSNNLVSMDSDSALSFLIYGRNKSTMTGISSLLTPATFTNVDNIIGGSNGNNFVFTSLGRMTGVIDGRARVDNDVVNKLDFTSILSQLDVNFSSTARISLGTVSNRVLGLITSFRAINDIVHTPAVSNGKIVLPNSLNTVVITGANAGYINNPIQFYNFQNIVSTSGQDSVVFNSFSVVNPLTGLSMMPTGTMTFVGFGSDAYSGNFTTTTATLDTVNDQIRYISDTGFDMLTDEDRSNLDQLVQEQVEIIDDLLKQTKVGTGAQCGT